MERMRITQIVEGPETLDEVFVIGTKNGVQSGRILHEGRWITGRFPDNIRIDRSTHFAGSTISIAGLEHAHVYGRKGDLIGVVNFDGTSSHGKKCKLHHKDADALRAEDFEIGPDNIVEWIALDKEGSIDYRILVEGFLRD